MKPEEQARLAEDLRELGIRGLADFLSHLSRVKKAYESGPSSSSDRPGTPAGLPDFAKILGAWPGAKSEGSTPNPVWTDYLLDLTKLGASYYRNLIDLNTAYWEKLAPKPEPLRRERRRQRYDRVVSADDERVVFQVEVGNQGAEDGRFSFLVSDFLARDGEGVRPALTITPPRPHVRAGEVERVTISVPIRGHFEPGKRYRARIAVRGPDELDLILRLRVRAA